LSQFPLVVFKRKQTQRKIYNDSFGDIAKYVPPRKRSFFLFKQLILMKLQAGNTDRPVP